MARSKAGMTPLTGKLPKDINMNKNNTNDPEDRRIWEVGTYSEDIFGPPPPPVRSLEQIRLDLKQKRIARRRRKQEREMARIAELRRQMIARRKDWDDAH